MKQSILSLALALTLPACGTQGGVLSGAGNTSVILPDRSEFTCTTNVANWTKSCKGQYNGAQFLRDYPLKPEVCTLPDKEKKEKLLLIRSSNT